MSKDQRTGDRHIGPRQRTVRGIDPALWQAAKDKVERAGIKGGVSAVVGVLLQRWVEEDWLDDDS